MVVPCYPLDDATLGEIIRLISGLRLFFRWGEACTTGESVGA